MEESNTGGTYLDEFFSSLEFGGETSCENLTIVSVFTKKARPGGYMLLEDAVKKAGFTIEEVSDGGSVPELRVKNGLHTDVLVLDGEALVGAKQNRIVNASIIIGMDSEVIIPVSCVEQGRWNYSRRNFTTDNSHLHASLRHLKARAVNENLKEGKRFRADQSEIWRDIRAKHSRMRVDSPTGAMQDMHTHYKQEIDKLSSAFTCHKDQIGFIALIDRKVAGGDIFGAKGILPKIHARLLRGYILDALDKEQSRKLRGKKLVEKPFNPLKPAKAFIEKARKADRMTFKSVGEGQDVRLESPDVTGFALLREQDTVHMAVFPDRARKARNAATE